MVLRGLCLNLAVKVGMWSEDRRFFACGLEVSGALSEAGLPLKNTRFRGAGCASEQLP